MVNVLNQFIYNINFNYGNKLESIKRKLLRKNNIKDRNKWFLISA